MSEMLLVITIEDENDTEVNLAFPAKHDVCPRCEGHGTHLNPSIGQHAYTPEEFNESFDEEEAAEYFKRGGMYDVKCQTCDGKRVIMVADEDQMNAEQKKQWAEHCEREERAAAERRAEMRWGY